MAPVDKSTLKPKNFSLSPSSNPSLPGRDLIALPTLSHEYASQGLSHSKPHRPPSRLIPKSPKTAFQKSLLRATVKILNYKASPKKFWKLLCVDLYS
jgi:hypothetical protein